ncbi:ribosome maturation factor RimM [Peptoniphilus catoniae]|uniref:ribosome maturation factor RimM n=1 Tax=Peptoniphilus catoniae TaxID=1660341 RepID=UPI0010FEABB2|nr:ribosome maturation factor RimM [Peptoniphilus catoniae]
MKKLSEFSIIGKIINTRGIKGEVKVLPMTRDIERFYNLDRVFLGEDLKEFEILKVLDNNKFVFITFKGYENINDVLGFKESYIYVPDSERIKLNAGEYFVSDIIGSEAVDLKGKHLGKIIDVIDNPANDVYVLESEAKEKSYIPAVSVFIKNVDVENKLITIDPIEGMIN